MINCILTGVGGQGTVFASKLLATAAINMGMEVRTTETIGMAQRGGSVVSHVRMGEKIDSPLIPPGMADIIIAFEPAEGVRNFTYLSENGAMIVCDHAIKPVTSSLSDTDYKADDMLDFLNSAVKNLTVLDGKKLLSECGGALNVALLGASMHILPFDIKYLENAITERTPEKFLQVNMAAFYAGKGMYDGLKSD